MLEDTLHHGGNVLQQELEVTSHSASTIKKQTVMTVYVQPTFYCLVPLSKWALLTSTNSIRIVPHRQAQRLISWVILDLKLTIGINHHKYLCVYYTKAILPEQPRLKRSKGWTLPASILLVGRYVRRDSCSVGEHTLPQLPVSTQCVSAAVPLRKQGLWTMKPPSLC